MSGERLVLAGLHASGCRWAACAEGMALCPCWPKFSLSMVTIGLNLYGRVDLEQLEYQMWP